MSLLLRHPLPVSVAICFALASGSPPVHGDTTAMELIELTLPFVPTSLSVTPDGRHVVAANEALTLQAVMVGPVEVRLAHRPARLALPSCDQRIMGYDRDGARVFVDANCGDGRWLRAVPLREGATYWNHAIDPMRRMEGTVHALADGHLLHHYTADLSGTIDPRCKTRDSVCLVGRVDLLDGDTGEVKETWDIRDTYAPARVATEESAALLFDYGRLWRFVPGKPPRSVAVRASVDEGFLAWDGGALAALITGGRVLPYNARSLTPNGKLATVAFTIESAVPVGPRTFLVSGREPDRFVAEVSFPAGTPKTRLLPVRSGGGLAPAATEHHFLVPTGDAVEAFARKDLSAAGRISTGAWTASRALPGALAGIDGGTPKLWVVRERAR